MNPYLTASEIASALRRSVWSVYRDAASGRIPCHRVNGRGRLLFDPPEVRAALAGNGPSPPADKCRSLEPAAAA
jgi:hypothetical protein